MTQESFNVRSLSTLLKYLLIGMGAAFAAFFVADLFKGSDLGLTDAVVEFNEISSDDAKQLAQTYAEAGQSAASYAQAVKLAAPAVVNIYTAKRTQQSPSPFRDDPLFKRFFGDEPPPLPREKIESSLGSGVIASEDGYVLTNNHVIEGAEEILVALQDGRNAAATVVGTDPESDLAVLKIVLDDLPVITFGHSDTLQIGDVALAIGNPFGVGQTVTMGIVSATGREHLGLSTFENFIQTDAAINPGNSGGALVNAFGHLIGVNTAIYSQSGGSQGIGFAIPIDVVRDVSQQIIEHGLVIRGWIGIEIQSLTPALAESFNLKDTNGVIIAGVLRNGPADKAGLTPGDIIVGVNGKRVTDATFALKHIAKARPGTPVELTILREGKKMDISVVTAQRPVPKQG